ncbi:MAG: SHOCT domain-containing protein [Clostridiales bacterium]|nr:SHOCT domain-containing protein [Clostridiales bacterium]
MMAYGGRGVGLMMAAGGGIVMLVTSLLFIALCILAIIALVKYLRNDTGNKSTGKLLNNSESTDNALNILNERFAKGEITTEQYSAMKEELKK